MKPKENVVKDSPQLQMNEDSKGSMFEMADKRRGSQRRIQLTSKVAGTTELSRFATMLKTGQEG